MSHAMDIQSFAIGELMRYANAPPINNAMMGTRITYLGSFGTIPIRFVVEPV